MFLLKAHYQSFISNVKPRVMTYIYVFYIFHQKIYFSVCSLKAGLFLKYTCFFPPPLPPFLFLFMLKSEKLEKKNLPIRQLKNTNA